MLNIRILALLMGACLVGGCATSRQQRTRFPVWYVPAPHTDIYGIGVGILSPVDWCDPDQPSTVTGIRAELLGTGLLWAYTGMEYGFHETYDEYLDKRKHDVAEIIQGLDVSLTGFTLNANVYGLSASGFANVKNNMHGIMLSTFQNQTRHASGIQAAAFNESYSVNGIQAGLYSASRLHRGAQLGIINHTQRLNGIQIGLWNRNQHRSLPIFNWASTDSMNESLPYDRWFPFKPKWRVNVGAPDPRHGVRNDALYRTMDSRNGFVTVYRFWASGHVMVQYHYDGLNPDHANSFRDSTVGYYASSNGEIEIETYLDRGRFRGTYIHERGTIDELGTLMITHHGRRPLWFRQGTPMGSPLVLTPTVVELEGIIPDW